MSGEKQTFSNIEQFLETQLDRVNYWLSFAEAKNGILLGVNIAIIAVLINMFDAMPIMCTICILFLLISSFFSILSFVPNLGKAAKKGNLINDNSVNLIFYKDIALFESYEEYLISVKEQYFQNKNDKNDSNSRLELDFAEEIVINSKICMKKYKRFNQAIKVDVISVILIAIFLLWLWHKLSGFYFEETIKIQAG